MKLNNKGFAISSILYIILIMAVVIVSITLSILTSRNLIIEKTKEEALNDIYNNYDITYREVLNILKSEIINYAIDNNITKESIKIDDFNTSIDKKIIKGYKLDTKYLTVILNNSNYDIYLGREETITGKNKEVKDLLDVIAYKIYGNSYQDLSSGVPSPTSPKEVVGVGNKVIDDTNDNYGKYNIPITVRSKNLLDNTKLLVTNTSNYKWQVTDTGIKQTKLSSGYHLVSLYDITDIVKPNTKYYFHRNMTQNYTPTDSTKKSVSGSLNLFVDGVREMRIFNYQTDNSFTMPDTFEKVEIKTWTVVGDEFIENFDSNIEYYFEWSNLYMGTEPYSEYSSYIEPHISNIYLDKPLRQVGGKTDYIDSFENKVKRNVGVYTFNSSIDVNYMKASSDINKLYNSHISFIYAKDTMVSGTKVAGYSNVLQSNKDSWNNWKEEQVHFGQNNRSIYIILNEPKATLDDMYNYLSNNGEVEPYFLYQLDVEKLEEVSLPRLNTSVGTQVISIDTNIKPSNVEFTVIKKIKQL